MFVGCGCRTCVGWGRSWIIEEWGGCCFIVVCRVVTASYHSYGCHVANRATWPLYPSGRRGTSATSSPLSTRMRSFVTLVWSSVCAVRAVGGRLWLVAVVAVGVSGEGAGPVGGDGGGWNGTSVTCLLIVDNNKSTKRVSVFADARFGCS